MIPEAFPVRVQFHARAPWGTCWHTEDCRNEIEFREAVRTAVRHRAIKSPIWVYRQSPEGDWREIAFAPCEAETR